MNDERMPFILWTALHKMYRAGGFVRDLNPVYMEMLRVTGYVDRVYLGWKLTQKGADYMRGYTPPAVGADSRMTMALEEE